MGEGRREAATPGAKDLVLAASGAVVATSILFAAVRQGAFFQPDLRILELACVVSVVLVVLARRRLATLDPALVVGVLLVGWIGARAVTAPAGNPGLEQAVMLLSAVCVYLAARLWDHEIRRLVAIGVVATGVVVALSALIGVATHKQPWALPLSDGWRASSTITYANGTACLLLLSLAVVAYADASVIPVWVARASGALMIAATLGTLCRGAVPAVIVGTLAARGAAPLFQGATTPVVAGGLLGFVGLLPSLDLGDPTRPLVAGVCVASGCLIASEWREPVRIPGPTADRRRYLAGMAVIAAPLGALVARPFLARATDLDSVTARTDSWSDYLDLFWSHPIAGVGPQAFGARFGEVYTATYFAHNEYLQVAAELGLVGLVLVLLGTVAVGRGVLRSGSGGVDPFRAAALAAGGALATFAFTDFVWNIPVIPITAAAVIGAGWPRVGAELGRPADLAT